MVVDGNQVWAFRYGFVANCLGATRLAFVVTRSLSIDTSQFRPWVFPKILLRPVVRPELSTRDR